MGFSGVFWTALLVLVSFIVIVQLRVYSDTRRIKYGGLQLSDLYHGAEPS